MESQIAVSVICLVYNHGKFLKKCLDNILSQKTTFNFEVIINDDASTDNSCEIIKEYERKYKGKIKAFYSKENLWVKGVDMIRHALVNASGKYVAICDGDDYWTNENKLQKQFEFMESHLDCSLCAHKILAIDSDTEEGLYYIPKKSVEKKELYTARDFLKNGYFIQTTSYFLRNSFAKEYAINPLEFNILCPAQDTSLILYSITKGNIGYIDEVMASYRVAVKNGWSWQLKEDEEKNKVFYERMIAAYEEFNHYTNGEYKQEIERATNYMAVIGNCREDLLKDGDIKRRKQYLRKERLKTFVSTKLKFLAKLWHKSQLK